MTAVTSRQDVFKLINDLLLYEGDYCLSFSVADNNSNKFSKFRADVMRLLCLLEKYPEQRWLLSLDDSYDFAVGLMVLLLAKKEVVLSANTRSTWLETIQDDVDAILADRELGVKNTQTLLFSAKDKAELLPIELPLLVTDRTINIFTSGSSSKPKKIKKMLSSLLLEVIELEKKFAQGFSKNKNSVQFISSVSHQHIYGLLFRLLWPLVFRRSFCSNILEYQEQLVEYSKIPVQIIFISSPAFLSRLDTKLSSANIDNCFSSGSPLQYTHSKDALNCLSCTPIEVYGSSETGGIGFRCQVKDATPWNNFSGVELLEREGRFLLKSPYLNSNDYYPLDDRLEIISNTKFFLLGRADRVVKIAEKRIALAQIETQLISSPLVDSAHALIIPASKPQLGCLLVLTPYGKKELASKNKLALVRELKGILLNFFDSTVLPKKWRFVDTVPYNSQGKLEMDRLLKFFGSEGEACYGVS